MKEIIISAVAVVIIAVAASYGLSAMHWSAASKYSTSNVRL
jgi:hypothetical protein